MSTCNIRNSAKRRTDCFSTDPTLDEQGISAFKNLDDYHDLSTTFAGTDIAMVEDTVMASTQAPMLRLKLYTSDEGPQLPAIKQEDDIRDLCWTGSLWMVELIATHACASHKTRECTCTRVRFVRGKHTGGYGQWLAAATCSLLLRHKASQTPGLSKQRRICNFFGPQE